MSKKEKRTFIMSYDWQDLFDNIKKPTEKVKLINAIFAHAQQQDRLTNIENSMSSETKMAWIMIKKSMTQFLNDYEEKCARNRQNASLGGQAKARNNLANATERYRTEATVSDRCPNDYDYDIKEKIYKKENSERYNFEEIKMFVQEEIKDTSVADKFIDFLTMRASLGKNKEVSTLETLQALITKLRILAKNKQEAISVLENSIINNLTDLYPPHKDKEKQNNGGLKYAN